MPFTPALIIELPGAPPTIFSPGSRSFENGTSERDILKKWKRLSITGAPIRVGRSFTQPASAPPKLKLQQRQTLVTLPVTLEITNEAGEKAALSKIRVTAVQTKPDELTFSNAGQQGPLELEVTANLKTKKVAIRVNLRYARLNVKEAYDGALFFQVLSKGGEFHMFSKKPKRTLTRGKINSGTYPGPEDRWIKLLKKLVFIQSKTGVRLNLPDEDFTITVDDAQAIFGVAKILETGHATYKSEPWESVSTVEQARAALSTFENEETVPSALKFEDQEVTILGVDITLGPVIFFCDQTYITKEDLETLRKDIEKSAPGDQIKVRITPFNECPIEARYTEWLPEDEAAAIRQLPIYEREKEGVSQETGSESVHPLAQLLSFATDMGVTDLAERHDYYAHGRRDDNADTR